MSSTPSQKPTGLTNELAKERNRAAAERTLTSWIQNCLSLIGFGIAFEHMFTALNRSFPKHSTVINTQLAHIIGLSAIAIGLFLLVLAIIGYLTEVKSIEQDNYLDKPPRSFNLIFVGSVVLFGLVALAVVVLGIGG